MLKFQNVDSYWQLYQEKTQLKEKTAAELKKKYCLFIKRIFSTQNHGADFSMVPIGCHVGFWYI
jgi:hypothetical protein